MANLEDCMPDVARESLRISQPPRSVQKLVMAQFKEKSRNDTRVFNTNVVNPRPIEIIMPGQVHQPRTLFEQVESKKTG